MTNDSKNKERFLSVFRREWEMYRTRDAASSGSSAGKNDASASKAFDPSPSAGELRLFADFDDSVTALLLGVSSKGWRVVPMSPFTVPASDCEILIGARAYQLWNTCELPVKTVSRSWIVDTVPPEDLADVKSALGVMRGEKLPEDLVACMGVPVTAADDPRNDYKRTFRLHPPAAVAERHRRWPYWGLAFAASLLIMVGSVVYFGNNSKLDMAVARTAMVGGNRESGQAYCASRTMLQDGENSAHESYKQFSKPTEPLVNIRDYETSRRMSAKAKAPMHTPAPASVAPEANVRFPERDAAYDERYAAFKENEFLEVTSNPLSTFGLDVDTASYATMRRYITEMKRLPPKDSVRIEEYVNYFSYDYAGPTGNVPVAVACELGACPWNAAHKLLRVGVQAKRVPKEAMPPCNLVFLIDKSGSMNGNGGFAMLIQAMKILVGQLRPEDSVAIVSYASGVQVELSATYGTDKARILHVLDGLRAYGATSGGAGLQLAYEEAMKNYSSKKNNRVVLVTDGDFNVGIRDPHELERFIEGKRKTGVFLTVLGVGYGNYRDSMMKKLANAGNGNYAFLDGILEAKKVLMTEFGGTMLTVAKDVKLQLEFNPAQVSAYRLLGYENRMLAAKDFNDDKKDAGEMGSGHSMTALYEIVPPGAPSDVAKTDALKYQKQMPVASGELLTVKLRYKMPNADTSTRMDMPVIAEAVTPANSSESFQFASAVAEFALLMKDSAYKGTASYDAVIKRAKGSKGRDDDGWRAEFIRLVESAQLLQANP